VGNEVRGYQLYLLVRLKREFEVRSDQVRKNNCRTSQDKIISGQVRSCQVSAVQCHVRSDQAWLGQIRSAKVKSGQTMSRSGQARTDEGISDQDMVSSAHVVRSDQVRSRIGQFRSG